MALRKQLSHLSEYIEFSTNTPISWDLNSGLFGIKVDVVNCSWFGFKLALKRDELLARQKFSKFLDNHKIGHRMLFGGNLTKQPAFVALKQDNQNSFRVATELLGADEIMNKSLFLGVYPGLTSEMIQNISSKINLYFTGHAS